MDQSQFNSKVDAMAQRLVAKAEQEYSKQYDDHMTNRAPAITAQALINDDDLYVYDLHHNQIVRNVGARNRISTSTYPVRPGQALVSGIQLKGLLLKVQS